MPRNPTWVKEELLLALDLYMRIGASYATKPEVIALSQLLNNLQLAEQTDEALFRNPNGVAMKLANFAALDPNYPGVALARGGKGDRAVWEEFANNPNELAKAVASILAGRELPSVSEVDQLKSEIEESAGRKTGQGFNQDAKARKVLEDYAMAAATKYLEGLNWSVKDVSKKRSFDLLCHRDGQEMHVEVKGTMSPGTSILLTPNEVRDARAGKTHLLFVLAEITLVYGESGEIQPSGGKLVILDPWKLDEANLKPLAFEYVLATERAETAKTP